MVSYRGIYLNQGNALFQELINSEIQVDKTMLIRESNRMICINYTIAPNIKYKNHNWNNEKIIKKNIII